jgi:hypothetical protein
MPDRPRRVKPRTPADGFFRGSVARCAVRSNRGSTPQILIGDSERAHARPLRTLSATAIRPAASAGAAHHHEQSRPAQLGRRGDARRACGDLARCRRRRDGVGGDPHRRRPRLLGGRRLRHDPEDHRRLPDPGAHLEGGARHRLQRHQLLEARGERHPRAGRGRGPRLRALGRRLDRHQGRAHHRRAHAIGRRRRRPCGDHLAASLRHGQGQVLPPAVRSHLGRRGRARRGSPRARPTPFAGPSTRSTTGSG